MIVRVNGQTVAKCNGSEIIGVTAKQEAEWLKEAYENFYVDVSIHYENPIVIARRGSDEVN